MKWRREIDESTLWCDVHSEALSDSALNHQHVHSACLAFPPENGYIRTIPLHHTLHVSLYPPHSLSSSTVFAFFYVKDKVLFWRRASIYMFWGVSHAWHWLPRAFSLFLQMHTHTYMAVHQWSLMPDQREPWGFWREPFFEITKQTQRGAVGAPTLCIYLPLHIHSLWQRGIFINASLIDHSQLSRLFLSIYQVQVSLIPFALNSQTKHVTAFIHLPFPFSLSLVLVCLVIFYRPHSVNCS